MALEEYIKTVKETWSSYTLDLVNYQNKCRLIRYVAKLIHIIYRKFTLSQGMGRPIQQVQRKLELISRNEDVSILQRSAPLLTP